MFFIRFFIGAAILVVLMGVEYSDRIPVGIAEFHVLVLLALAGMMFAASASDFILVFVSLELITVSFYVLVSFQRGRLGSLEAGVKYLVMGGLSAAFLVFGIALVFAASNSTNFNALNLGSDRAGRQPAFLARPVADVDGAGLQDRRFPHANVGAGCLPGSADARDRLSRHCFQGRRLRPAPAGVVHGRPLCFAPLADPVHGRGRDQHSLRQPLRAAATELEAAARLLQHRPCGLHDARRGGP